MSNKKFVFFKFALSHLSTTFKISFLKKKRAFALLCFGQLPDRLDYAQYAFDGWPSVYYYVIQMHQQ